MYATAHRVSRNGQSGINAFLHLHGPEFPWTRDAASLPEDNPGRLQGTWTALPPGGNLVHSYLDILAPDGTPRAALMEALEALRRDLSERRNPTIFISGPVTLRFGVQIGLESQREAEFESLVEGIRPALMAL